MIDLYDKGYDTTVGVGFFTGYKHIHLTKSILAYLLTPILGATRHRCMRLKVYINGLHENNLTKYKKCWSFLRLFKKRNLTAKREEKISQLILFYIR